MGRDVVNSQASNTDVFLLQVQKAYSCAIFKALTDYLKMSLGLPGSILQCLIVPLARLPWEVLKKPSVTH